jgi:multidrug efflux system outer membrane protein
MKRCTARRLGMRAGAVVSAAALSACATWAPVPEAATQAPFEVPAEWANKANKATQQADAAAPASLAQWWRRFEDPLLVSLIEETLRANTSVRTARAALAQARALADVQQAGLLPALNANASAQRSRAGDAGSSNVFKTGFDASWEPDVFGGRRSAVNATQADALASAASLGDVQTSIAAEVALDYLQLRGAQARMALAQASLASFDETLQLTQWRAQAGLTTELDVEQARTAAAQTRASLPALQTTAAQLEHALDVLAWRAPGTSQQRLSAAAAPTAGLLTPPEGLAISFPADTVRQRADVRAAQARVVAATARVQQAQAARLPSFGISGSLGLSALSLGSLANSSAIVGALLGSVSAPLFDGGAARATVLAQQAALAQTRSAYDAALLQALQDVEDGLVALRNDRARQAQLRVAAQSAANAATLARQRYASGLIDFQTVLETQRSALSTQDALATVATDLNTDHVRLYKALGGGWEADSTASPAAALVPYASNEKP